MLRPSTTPVTRLPILTVIVALVLLLAACGSSTQLDAGDGGTGDGGNGGNATMATPAGTWILTSVIIDGATVELPLNDDGSPRPLELVIESGSINGDGGCNGFGGSIELGSDGTASIADLFITEMACMPIEILDFESIYVNTLAAATAWAVDPAGLTLSSDSATLSYEPAPPVEHAKLLDTTWELDSIYLGEGANRAVSSADMSTSPAKLILDGQSATLSSDDCDPISFDVSHEPGQEGSFSVLDPAVDLGCDNPNMMAARDGLVVATGFMVFDQQLTFIGLPGETVGFIAR